MVLAAEGQRTTMSGEQPHKGLSTPSGAVGLRSAESGCAHAMTCVWRDTFGIAVWLRDESAKWRDRGERAAEMRCAFACLIHCYITVEACVNGYGAWFLLASDEAPSSQTLKALERLDTATKLLVYPRLFAGRSVFDASQELHQSFLRLKKLRDWFAVHPKPRMRLDEGVAVGPDGKLRIVDAVPRISSLSGLEEWKGKPRCDADGAAWGCRVVRELAAELSHPEGLAFDLAVVDSGE